MAERTYPIRDSNSLTNRFIEEAEQLYRSRKFDEAFTVLLKYASGATSEQRNALIYTASELIDKYDRKVED